MRMKKENIMSDWLPSRREDQLAMARNWISIVNAPGTTPPWGIPPAQITELITLFDAAQDILLKASNESERTTVVTAQYNMAFKALTDKMRFFRTITSWSRP
jgi:hypothetical protein